MIISRPTEYNILTEIIKYKKSFNADFIILCGENVEIDYHKLIDILNSESINFCGGIFPKVIYKNQSYCDHVLILPVKFGKTPSVVLGLDNGDVQIPSGLDSKTGKSLFILNDGLSNWISKFVFHLYDELGSNHHVFGSGAGFSSFKRENCLFCHEGFFMDVAIIVPISNNITQSTRHGWKPIAGPYIATRTSANLLEELNWKPAYTVCKSILESQENTTIDADNYYKYAKRYPFGIRRSNSEYLIRDPVNLESETSIRFGAEIPSNSVLYLMNSADNDMLKAGSEACKEVISQCENPLFMFVADCISRTWILNERFLEELDNINDAAREIDLTVYGVYSMGEISSSNGGLLDYHHKTIVVSVVEKA